ncbi:MAG: hypothetical protein ABJA66_08470 [Actinomycetota bacterium]
MKSRITIKKYGVGLWSLVFGLWMILFFLSNEISAQSTNQNYPTPVISNEISGTIKARDPGDSRLTSYFYVFNGNQGDIFINVVTKNLNGDIDIFTADNLKPLTKITVYSDNSDSETGRVVYLRQPQKLILRIEGKSPIDEPASFKIKFAGSFEAIAGIAETDESKQPEVKNDQQGEVRVNSVGTIIEIKPKPTPKTKETTALNEKEEQKKIDERKESEKVETVENETAKKDETKVKTNEKEDKKNVVVKTDNLPQTSETVNNTDNKTDEITVADKDQPKNPSTVKKQVKPRRPKATKTEPKPKNSTTKTETKPKTTTKKTELTVEPGQLENIRLIVLFKDGTKIERAMSEILKVSVDQGILTVILKDGTIGRYSILDVAKMTIE